MLKSDPQNYKKTEKTKVQDETKITTKDRRFEQIYCPSSELNKNNKQNQQKIKQKN